MAGPLAGSGGAALPIQPPPVVPDRRLARRAIRAEPRQHLIGDPDDRHGAQPLPYEGRDPRVPIEALQTACPPRHPDAETGLPPPPRRALGSARREREEGAGGLGEVLPQCRIVPAPPP